MASDMNTSVDTLLEDSGIEIDRVESADIEELKEIYNTANVQPIVDPLMKAQFS